MFTILKRKKKRRSSFAEAYSDDPSWSLVDRMTAKRKIKKLTIPELIAKVEKDYEEMEQIEYELEETDENDEQQL